MKNQRDYHNEFRDLEADLCADIEKNLKRIGKKLTEKNSNLGFWGFAACADKDIEAFTPDGGVIYSLGLEVSIFNAVNEGMILTWDAIDILDDLRKIKSKKK